jgi:hypothetical protein
MTAADASQDMEIERLRAEPAAERMRADSAERRELATAAVLAIIRSQSD